MSTMTMACNEFIMLINGSVSMGYSAKRLVTDLLYWIDYGSQYSSCLATSPAPLGGYKPLISN